MYKRQLVTAVPYYKLPNTALGTKCYFHRSRSLRLAVVYTTYDLKTRLPRRNVDDFFLLLFPLSLPLIMYFVHCAFVAAVDLLHDYRGQPHTMCPWSYILHVFSQSQNRKFWGDLNMCLDKTLPAVTPSSTSSNNWICVSKSFGSAYDGHISSEGTKM